MPCAHITLRAAGVLANTPHLIPPASPLFFHVHSASSVEHTVHSLYDFTCSEINFTTCHNSFTWILDPPCSSILVHGCQEWKLLTIWSRKWDGEGSPDSALPSVVAAFSPKLKAAKFVFCTGSSHGKCYSDHSFDYNGAIQNMSLGSVLGRKEEPFFIKQAKCSRF